jgi:hypothetical protein
MWMDGWTCVCRYVCMYVCMYECMYVFLECKFNLAMLSLSQIKINDVRNIERHDAE